MEKLIFTPSLFFQHAICPHWIWHDLYSDAKDKAEISEFTQKLYEEGVTHEADYIKGLKFIEVEEVDPQEAFQKTLELMKGGADLIYQGSIQYEADGVLYRGRPDLLEKRSGKSSFGNYFYAPIDIKFAKHLKKPHILQLTLYGIILEQVQGIFPDKSGIINGERERIEKILEADDRIKTIDQIYKIIDIMKNKKPAPRLTSSCKQSPWFAKCVEEAEKSEDIALIYKLDSRAHPVLRENGIKTIHDAAKMDIYALPKIPYASADVLERIKLQAQALVDKDIKWRNDPEIPKAPLKIYFDIEGDPLLQLEYLFGFWVAGDPGGKYAKVGNVRFDEESKKYFIYFIAEKQYDEQAMWNQFLQWLKLLPENGYFVYHYADYERSHTRKLADKYGTSAAFENFVTKFVDFQKIVADCVIFPLYFYSIKDIAKSKFLNYKWRHAKAGGGQSVFWYEKWLETDDRNILKDIVDYNEDDVVATEYLHQWLSDNKK